VPTRRCHASEPADDSVQGAVGDLLALRLAGHGQRAVQAEDGRSVHGGRPVRESVLDCARSILAGQSALSWL